MSAERYRRLLQLTRAYPDLYSWLADGLAALEDGHDLAQALGLRGIRAVRARNQLLAQAAALVAPGQKPWIQADALRKAVQRAQTTPDRSKVSRLIRDAQLYKAIPHSQRGLYDVITAEKIEH